MMEMFYVHLSTSPILPTHQTRFPSNPCSYLSTTPPRTILQTLFYDVFGFKNVLISTLEYSTAELTEH